jgi:ABC-type long-subunit fatty acid transport system fused permease/ATPase subunit
MMPAVGLDPIRIFENPEYRSDQQNPRFPMSLVTVVLTLIVVGVLLWLINTYIPMAASIKSILNFVVVVAVVLWLLYGFGVLGHSGEIRLPEVK